MSVDAGGGRVHVVRVGWAEAVAARLRSRSQAQV